VLFFFFFFFFFPLSAALIIHIGGVFPKRNSVVKHTRASLSPSHRGFAFASPWVWSPKYIPDTPRFRPDGCYNRVGISPSSVAAKQRQQRKKERRKERKKEGSNERREGWGGLEPPPSQTEYVCPTATVVDLHCKPDRTYVRVSSAQMQSPLPPPPPRAPKKHVLEEWQWHLRREHLQRKYGTCACACPPRDACIPPLLPLASTN